MTNTERKRLEAVLPFYLNGTASTEDRAFVEVLLGADNEAAAMLDWHDGLSSRIRADVERAPLTVGWAALQAKLRADREQSAAARPAGRSWWARLSPAHWLPQAALGPVFAGLLAAVVLQAGLIGSLVGREGGVAHEGAWSETRGVEASDAAGTAAAARAYLRVNFKDGAGEREMRLLLISIGASIVSGPGQLGDYVLAVSADQAKSATQEIERSGLAESVKEVKAPTPLQP